MKEPWGTCPFLIDAVHGNSTHTETLKHLSECEECRNELKQYFTWYQQGDMSPIETETFSFPPGIPNEKVFLERWFILEAGQNEDKDFSLDEYERVIEAPEVKEEIRRLVRRQTMAIESKVSGMPSVFIGGRFDLIETTYRKLYKMMGHRAFWCYFSYEIPSQGDDRSIEGIIAWWREALLGAQK